MNLLYMMLLLSVPAAGPQVECRLDRTSARVGEGVYLEVTVRGPEAADCMLNPWPAEDPFVVIARKGPDFTMVPADGGGAFVLEARFTVKFVPLEAGSRSLPPVKIQVRRGEARSFSAPRLNVIGHTEGEASGRVLFRLEGPGRPVYLHERFLLTLVLELPGKVYAALEQGPEEERFFVPGWERSAFCGPCSLCPPEGAGPSLAVPFPGGGGRILFTVQEGGGAGKEGVRLAAAVACRADRIGTCTLAPSFFRAVDAEGRVIFRRSPALRVEVAPLPAAGRPACATNGVGPLEVRFHLEPRQVRAGSPVRFSMEVTGTGDLSYLVLPEYPELTRDFSVAAVRDENGPGRRVRRFDLLPRKAGSLRFPALAFAWFEPGRGRYETARFGPEPVTVVPAAREAVGAGDVSKGCVPEEGAEEGAAAGEGGTSGNGTATAVLIFAAAAGLLFLGGVLLGRRGGVRRRRASP